MVVSFPYSVETFNRLRIFPNSVETAAAEQGRGDVPRARRKAL
jgi:hypothetical protein